MRVDYETARSIGRLDRLGGCVAYWERSPRAFDRKPKTYRNGYTAGWYSVTGADAGTQPQWRTDAERNRGRVL